MEQNFCEYANPIIFEGENWNFPKEIADEIDYVVLKTKLFSLSNELEKSGRVNLAHNVALLAHVCGMVLQTDEPGIIFKPFMTWKDGSHTPVPDILTDVHLKVLKTSISKIDSFAIRARIYEILWLKDKKERKENATMAIENYIKLTKRIRTGDLGKISIASVYLKRAIQLWLHLGADSNFRNILEEEVELCMMLENPEPPNFVRFFFYALIPKCFDPLEITKWINMGEKLLENSLVQKNFDKARSYVEAMIEIFKVAKDPLGVQKMREKHSDLFVIEACTLNTENVDPMILQDRYNKAIEACRNSAGKKETAKELHKELLEIQKKIPGNLKKISVPINMKPVIDDLIFNILEKTFQEALEDVALLALPPRKKEQYQQAQKILKDFPLQSLCSKILLDEKGKIVAKRSGMGSSPEEYSLAVRFQASEQYKININLKGLIIFYGQIELFNKSGYENIFFDSLLYPNPFVPTTKIAQFKRGLISGLRGDWISCLAILVPQLENSLRHIMQLSGHNLVIIESNGIQKEKDLNAFIYSEEFQNIFGPDWQFQLQVLLADQTGLNLRNLVAHGLLTDNEALSSSAPFVWAVTLLLCMIYQKQFYSKNIGPIETNPDLDND